MTALGHSRDKNDLEEGQKASVHVRTTHSPAGGRAESRVSEEEGSRTKELAGQMVCAHHRGSLLLQE